MKRGIDIWEGGGSQTLFTRSFLTFYDIIMLPEPVQNS
jgi:hypothetical protein